MKIAIGLSFVATLWTAAIPGYAVTLRFSYGASNGGAPLTASGLLNTAETLNVAGSYDITGLSGSVGGDPTAALTTNPTGSAVSTSPDGLFTYDNVVFGPLPSLSNAGVLFTSASGFGYNLFSDSATTYEVYQVAGGTDTGHSVGTLILADVPEPTTWALMLTGFVMVGFAARRRRLPLSA